MDKAEFFNMIFEFLSFGFRIECIIKDSGQRCAYFGYHSANGNNKVVVKICDYHTSVVPRIQRELRILNGLNSDYFPKSLKNTYITTENISNYLDNLDPANDKVKIDQIKSMKIRPFFVTVEEYINHITWTKVTQSLKEESVLVDFLVELFTALDLLWKDKIAHRDLKPDNILIRPELKPVIIDLGIAKSFRDGTNNLTHSMFTTPCTPCYASPEQLNNAKDEITYKSDQFSIGVIAYELLTGQFPYGDIRITGEAGLMKNFKEGNLADIRSVNPKVGVKMKAFLGKLLAVQPYQRFRRSEDILNALRDIKSG